MIENKLSFSPSVNIIRDSNKELNYIVTKNSSRTANQLISDFNSHLHCFSLIGSYGTGKSSFLWALEKDLKNGTEYFFKINGQFNNFKEFEIVNIVGSYSPIEELFQKALGLNGNLSLSNLLPEIENFGNKCNESGKFLVIIIDEFGKILEYAAQNEPEKRIYFLQELAELVNDPEKNMIFINALHQNFNAYSGGLNNEQKQEWNKVRGRFIELPFNEPLEQLLFLAAEHIKLWHFDRNKNPYYQSVNDRVIASGLLPISDEYANKLFPDLIPLDIISACILTKALQDYGQNERSLFTLLAKRTKDSLYHSAKEGEEFNIIKVYDFLHSSFYPHIFDKHNRDKNKWDRIKISLERVHPHFSNNKILAEKIIKIIGILSIYGNKGGSLNEEFLSVYLNDPMVLSVLTKLVNLKIILFRKHLSSYSLTEGTDLDYYEAIENAGSKVEAITDVAHFLNQYYLLPCISAKKISYERGTPRYFKFILVSSLEDEIAVGEIDGYIYLVFDQDQFNEDFTSHSKKSSNANVFVNFQNIAGIKKIIFEIQKANIVLQEIENDKVAESELKNIIEALRIQLNNEVLEGIYSNTNKTRWFFNGQEELIDSERKLNKLLSKVCETIFYKTPIIKNELINKQKISSAISTARKKYIKALLNNYNLEDLGFETTKYPPEKTIYQSLLKYSGIHCKLDNGNYGFQRPQEESLLPLWKLCEDFLKEATGEEKNISQLFAKLRKHPFKLKDGLINFWVPTFLIIKRDEYALFKDGNYIPFLSEELFDLLYKNPSMFSLKTYPFGGVEISVFNKYRELFDINSESEITNQNIIETIKPFLLFYKGLPEYALNTERLSPPAKDFRNALGNATDPFSAFFKEFPKTLGYNEFNINNDSELIEQYILSLQKVISELRNAYYELIARFELQIKKISNTPNKSGLEIKEHLNNQFSLINIDRLSGSHRKLLSRFRIPYENSGLWFESISMAILDKPLSKLTDKDEDILYSSFEKFYRDLVDLIPIYQLAKQKNVDPEEVIGIKIISSKGEDKVFQSIINNKNKKIAAKLKEKILSEFGNLNSADKKAILFELINNLIDEES